MSGELGSGKTTFVRGACRALGVARAGHEPDVHDRPRATRREPEVAHLDLYRLGSLAGEDPALLEDYLTRSGSGFVEWPARRRAGARAGACAGAARARGRRPAPDHGRVTLLGLDTSTRAASACVLRADGAGLRAHAAGASGCWPAARARERADARGGRVMERRGRRAGATSTRSRWGSARARSRGCGSGSPRRARSPRRRARRSGRVSSLAALAARHRRAAPAPADRRAPGRAVRRAVRRRARAVAAVRGRPRGAGRAPAARPVAALWQRETGRYDFGESSRRPASSSAQDIRGSMWCSALSICRLAVELRTSRRRPCSPTTCESPTPSPNRDPRPRHPPPDLRGPAAGDRDRAARVPDALVAGDVRAGAVEAVGHLPGRARGGRDRRLSRLLALRHRLARHERRGRADRRATASPARCSSACSSRPTGRASSTRSRCAPRTTPPSPLRALRLPRRRAPPRATTTTTARTP